MTCPRCAQKNEKTAAYCSACGQQISFTPVASPVVDWSLWRRFVGHRADYYLKRFETFQKGTSDRFRPTWNWPAFGVGWLWYLYRKMYLHAAVFLFGGLLPMVLGAGLAGVVIWNVFAAVSANFLYYMHVKLSLANIERRAGTDTSIRDQLISDLGGIQPYVWWLAMILMVIAIVLGILEAPPSTQ